MSHKIEPIEPVLIRMKATGGSGSGVVKRLNLETMRPEMIQLWLEILF